MLNIPMLIIELIHESKFRPTTLMYHGTSSVFLRSILKHGMQPNPKQRVWTPNDTASIATPTMASLSGSYWTSDLSLAQSSSNTAVKRVGGEPILIMAQIQTQQAKADEDVVTPDIDHAVNTTITRMMRVNAKDYDRIINLYWYKLDDWQMNTLYTQFAHEFHKTLTRNPQQPPDKKLAQQVLDSYMRRILAHRIEKMDPESKKLFLDNIKNRSRITADTIPTISQAEQDYLEVRDRVTQRYRDSTTYNKSETHVLRMTDPVGYSGASHIVNIVGLSKSDKPLIVYYGSSNLPNKFINDYPKVLGPIPQIITKSTEKQ